MKDLNISIHNINYQRNKLYIIQEKKSPIISLNERPDNIKEKPKKLMSYQKNYFNQLNMGKKAESISKRKIKIKRSILEFI